MLERFERYPLTFGSTPIEALPSLSEHLDGKANMLVAIGSVPAIDAYSPAEPYLRPRHDWKTEWVA